MILTLDNKECATLTLHMSIMRKSMRNLLKKKYPGEKNEFLESYDYIHEKAKKGLEASEHFNVTHFTDHYNIRDLKVLTEFLRAYIEQINNLGVEIKGEDKEHVEVMADLLKKCSKVIQDVEENQTQN
ncbi:hypothetical protein SFC08_16760 [Lysinibacillus halotolerans]